MNKLANQGNHIVLFFVNIHIQYFKQCVYIILICLIPCLNSSKYKFSEPRVHGFVYEPTTGVAINMDIDFADEFEGLRPVYDLYSANDTAK